MSINVNPSGIVGSLIDSHVATAHSPNFAHMPLIAIVGGSGTGKSTSLRNCKPESTEILDIERKGFPFKGSKKFDITPIESADDFFVKFAFAVAKPKNRLIIVESFAEFCELAYADAQNKYKGYDIFNAFNRSVAHFLNVIKNTKCYVAVTAIDEIVALNLASGATTNVRRIKVKGKEWEGMVEKKFTLVLFTEPKKTADGKIVYTFQTNTDGITSAKTPIDMFEHTYIGNDLNAVIEACDKYNE